MATKLKDMQFGAPVMGGTTDATTGDTTFVLRSVNNSCSSGDKVKDECGRTIIEYACGRWKFNGAACAESIACGCYCVNATCCGVTVSGLYKCGNGAVTDCGGNKVIYWDSSCSKWKFNGEATSGGGGGGSCIACGSYNVTASCCGVTICGLYRGGNAITDSCGTSLIYWDSMCSQWKFNGAAACGGGGGCGGYACYADYLGCPCGCTTLYVSGCALYFKNKGCNGYITLVEKNMLSDCSKVLVWCG